MKYSPLVERYILSHNYETTNNVWEWKMLLTSWHEIQTFVDEKFSKYKKIREEIKKEREEIQKSS